MWQKSWRGELSSAAGLLFAQLLRRKVETQKQTNMAPERANNRRALHPVAPPATVQPPAAINFWGCSCVNCAPIESQTLRSHFNSIESKHKQLQVQFNYGCDLFSSTDPFVVDRFNSD
jgi:hypothetical protein